MRHIATVVLALIAGLPQPSLALPPAVAPLPTGEFEGALEDLAEQIEAGTSPSSRMTVAVLEFEGLSGGLPSFARYTAEVLSTDLARRGRFRVIERRRLDRMLEELKLNASGLFDPKRRKEFGRVSGVQAILIGSYQNFASSVRLNARLVATETGEYLSTGSVTAVKDGGVKKLVGEPGPGSITVNTQEGARVYLNGALRGKAEEGILRMADVPAGSHQIDVRKAGRRRVSTTIYVGDSEDISTTISMNRMPGPEAMLYSLLFPGAGSAYLGRSMFGGGTARYAPMTISVTCLSFYLGSWLGERELVKSAERHDRARDFGKAEVRYKWARILHRSKPYMLYAGAGMAAADVVYCFFAGAANSLMSDRVCGPTPHLTVVFLPDGTWRAGIEAAF